MCPKKGIIPTFLFQGTLNPIRSGGVWILRVRFRLGVLNRFLGSKWHLLRGVFGSLGPLVCNSSVPEKTWMYQELSECLVNGSYNLLINGIYWGDSGDNPFYKPFANILGHPSRPFALWLLDLHQSVFWVNWMCILVTHLDGNSWHTLKEFVLSFESVYLEVGF